MARLGKNEKRLIVLAVALVCAIVLAEFVVGPALSHREELERRVDRAETALVDIRILSEDLLETRAKTSRAVSRLGNRPPGFNLFSFLDALAGQAEVKPHLAYMNPSATPIPDSPYRNSQVELKLDRISMELLLGYLYKIENSRNEVFVRRMKITESGKDEPFVDAVLQVVTLERAG